jgi:hypothetical protein
MGHSMPRRGGGGAGDLGTWEAVGADPGLRGDDPSVPEGPPEWARVRRAGAGHGAGQVAWRRGVSGARGVRPVGSRAGEHLIAHIMNSRVFEPGQWVDQCYQIWNTLGTPCAGTNSRRAAHD